MTTSGTIGLLRRWALIGALAFVGTAGLALCGGTRAQAQETAEQAADSAEHPGGELPAHETPQINVKSLALQLLNFGVLIFVLVKFGGPAIGKALAARHQQLKADLAAASAARAEAEARLAQQEARLAALEQEIEGIRTGVKAEAEAEKTRLIAMAEERAKRIREETTFVLEQQVKEAEERLRREVALASVNLAEQMVKKSLVAADQQRLVDTFVTDVAAPGNAPAPRGQA
jgi:F-type H+-transporting ATPase subunit b